MNIGVETEKTEFKKTTGELREGIISLASMLNKNGYGVLYFGVKDNGEHLVTELFHSLPGLQRQLPGIHTQQSLSEEIFRKAWHELLAAIMVMYA